VAPVSSANRGDPGGVARRGEPVVDRGADPATLNRRLARPVMAGDQQNDPDAVRNRPIEAEIDRPPRGLEVHAVKIEDAVRFDRAVAKPPVPAAVERRARCRANRLGRRLRPSGARTLNGGLRLSQLLRCFSDLRFSRSSRQRPDRGRHPAPQIRFLRAEGAHARPSPWGSGSAPRHCPTCRRRLLPPPNRRPKKCRSGSGP
jgi:hypothetical protein